MASAAADASDDPPVVLLAADQRQPVSDDEPRCVVCGRYGEYICDATDEDVCSIECRDVCVLRHGETLVLSQEQAKQRALEATLLRRRLGIRVTSGVCSADSSSTDRTTSTSTMSYVEVSVPIRSFTDCALPPQLLANLQSAGFATPSPVQMQVIPCVLQRQNLLVVAPTGTGKTAAFLIPVLAQLVNAPHALALVLAPVRELAIQIEAVAKLLARGIASMKTALLVGGLPVPPQLHRLQTRVQLVVATPGRFIDIFTSYTLEQTTPLHAVATCVVDEVDTMLAIGFQPQIAQILALLPACPQLQLLFFSATSSTRVDALVQRMLGDATASVRVEVGVQVARKRPSRWQPLDGSAASTMVPAQMTPTTTYTVNANVEQELVWVDDKAKKRKLFEYLASQREASTVRSLCYARRFELFGHLVFVRSKVGADLLADAVTKQTHIPAAAIHGDKSQRERLAALEAFVTEDVRVLVSTNVLSRGIDLLHVQRVVVFDFPLTVADYIHLIGRTGRGTAADTDVGHALAMVNTDDRAVFRDLVELLHSNGDVRVPQEVYEALAVDAKRAAFKSSARVVDEAKRAFRIHEEVSGGLAWPLTSWREWTDHQVQKKPRRA